MSNKIKKKEEPVKKQDGSLKNTIITVLILGVIALEVVLIFYFMWKRSHPTPQSTAKSVESSEETGPVPVEDSIRTGNPDIDENTVVTWRGKELHLVPGTGTEGTLSGARLDYGEDLWWEKEGLIGQYSMTEEDAAREGVTDEFAELTIYGNGTVLFIFDDGVYSGELMTARYYDTQGGGYIIPYDGGTARSILIDFVDLSGDAPASYAPEDVPDADHIEVTVPFQEEPEEKREIHVYLTRIEGDE